MPGGFQDVARDELERFRLNQLAYNTAPEATTLGELAPAVTAHIAAGLLTPETFLNPFFKVGGVAWQAAHPFLARMFGYQLGQAAVQAVADPVTQAMQIKAGVSTAYDWRQTAWSIPLGAAWGTPGASPRWDAYPPRQGTADCAGHKPAGNYPGNDALRSAASRDASA